MTLNVNINKARSLSPDPFESFTSGAFGAAGDAPRGPVTQPPRFLSTAASALFSPGGQAGPRAGGWIVLHIGSGPADGARLHAEFRKPGWHEVRVDLDPAVAPDLLTSMTDLSPVPAGSVHAVYCSHSLEHLQAHDVPRALREFARVLRPEGVALLVAPDLQRVAELVAADRLTETAYESPAGPIAPLDIIYGHRPSLAAGFGLMAHRTGFTARSLGEALLAAGFANVDINRQGFDLWAIAHKSAPTG